MYVRFLFYCILCYLLISAVLLRRTLSLEFNESLSGIQPRQDHVLTMLFSRENFLEFCRRESPKTCTDCWSLCFAILLSVTAVKSIWVAWQHMKWPKVRDCCWSLHLQLFSQVCNTSSTLRFISGRASLFRGAELGNLEWARLPGTLRDG